MLSDFLDFLHFLYTSLPLWVKACIPIALVIYFVVYGSFKYHQIISDSEV